MEIARPRGRWPGALAALVAGLAGLAGCAGPTLDLQGHRGARGLAPENSLPAFERAMAIGVTTLELDVGITRDGVVVIHHDLAPNPAYARDAQGRWLEQPGAPIAQRDFAELQALDIGRLKPGTRYAAGFPDQVPHDGTRIPRLADLFDRVKRGGHDRMRFSIETKLSPLRPEATRAPDAFAQALVDEVRKAGLQRRVQIQSFDWRSLQVVQRIAPEIGTVYLTAQQNFLDNIAADKPEGSPWTAGFQWRDHGSVPRMVKAAGGRVWSPYFGDVDAAKVKEAQSLGLKVVVWTVNDEVTMGRMIDFGVDGLITDRPDLASRLLVQRGIQPR